MRGQEWGIDPIRIVSWATCITDQYKEIAPSWSSDIVLASVLPEATTKDLKSQAKVILDNAHDAFYMRGIDKVVPVSSRSTTVDGHQAWETVVDVHVSNYGPDVPGDRFMILVVDTGNGNRSAMLTFVTLGDKATAAEIAVARADVRVEP